MHPTSPAALLVAALLLSGPASLAAQAAPLPQRSDPTGFHIAGRVAGAGIVFEDEDEAETGAGLALALGWGVNRTLTLFAEGAGASIELMDGSDTYTLAHFDLGVRLNFRGPEATALPYLTLAYSGRSAGLDVGGDLLTITGAGPTFGGGIAVFLSRSAALDLGLRWTAGAFTEAEYLGDTESIDVSATSARFDLGVSWWAGR